MISKITACLMVSIALLSCTVSGKEHTNGEDGQKKQVVVVHPPRKSSHPGSDVIVIGRGEESGDDEDIDKETISTLSNNILSTTNLVHSQSQLIQNLVNQLQNLQNSFQTDKEKTAQDIELNKQDLIEVSDKIRNATNLVNVMVLMWSKSEKSFVRIIDKLESKIAKERAVSDKNGKMWEQRLAALEKKMGSLQADTEKARRLAASKKSRWPHGRYCILANGACPSGFYRQRGFLKTVYMYGTNAQYVKSMRMGSSYIGCYGQRCGQYGHYATINIATCCK